VSKTKLTHVPDDALKEIVMIQNRIKQLSVKEKAQVDFIDYVKNVWDGFIEGEHHKLFAKKLEAVAQGKCKRLIVNMPPRHTKSEFASVFFPSWIMGLRPDMKIMQTTHTAELSARFGRKVRNLMDTDEYKQIFDKVTLSADSKSAGRWETNKGGEYFAAGVGGAITGRGADLLIIDDPHSEQDALSPSALESAYEWYTSGPRQRLQPGGIIVIVMTRWSTLDLTEKLIRRMSEEHADQWDILELPAILESGEPLWPGYWKLEELEAVKASIPISKWNSQYMQNPTSEEGALIKRDWWQTWEHDDPPNTSYILQSYDTRLRFLFLNGTLSTCRILPQKRVLCSKEIGGRYGSTMIHLIPVIFYNLMIRLLVQKRLLIIVPLRPGVSLNQAMERLSRLFFWTLKEGVGTSQI